MSLSTAVICAFMDTFKLDYCRSCTTCESTREEVKGVKERVKKRYRHEVKKGSVQTDGKKTERSEMEGQVVKKERGLIVWG